MRGKGRWVEKRGEGVKERGDAAHTLWKIPSYATEYKELCMRQRQI